MPRKPLIACLLICALAGPGCQSPSRPQHAPPVMEIPPLPPEIKKREPNLLQRLLQLLQPLDTKATTPYET